MNLHKCYMLHVTCYTPTKFTYIEEYRDFFALQNSKTPKLQNSISDILEEYREGRI